ncbi:hypothetical protein H0A61_01420 [Koleobacter methoxysyntrophicus]|uniref:ATP synthase I chain n=1 Tax=Koleobacter methoxysyntrophicus TaxID=2751313 RepID=A0A8A0RKW2_9FIRM|nr:ATP synthase subunit I [Koleobacter methoxysyntrophicus]NPV44319.1 hypothetical protein [Bacillota bacterium]QSQ09061.1 hypothetical protein H0A61_01420 [Koleobacter methoxysyntrophicus]
MNFQNLQFLIIRKTLIAASFISIIILYAFDEITSLFWFFYGIIISILNFRLLALNVKKSIRMTPEKSRIYAFTGYTVRYVLNFIAFMVAVKSSATGLLLAAAGYLLIKAVIIADPFLNHLKFRKE